MPEPKQKSPRFVLLGLAACVLVAFVLHLGIGSSVHIPPQEVIRLLLAGPKGDASHTFIVWQLRLPRAMACICAGALLAGAGSAFQALFKNRLADPYTVGTASGAAIGGVTAIALGWDVGLAQLGVPLVAFVAAMLSLGLLMLLARRRGTVETPTLLLAGVLLGSLLNSLMSVILLYSGKDTNVILRWLMGGVTPMFWPRVAGMAAVLVVMGGWLLLRSRELNALAFGEETAARLGADVRGLKRLVLGGGGLMTAAAVGSCGIIPFVGMIAPHIARRLVGVDWRYSMLGAMLMGSLLLLIADAITQRVLTDSLPVGITMALIGAPFLLALLGRKG